MSMIWAMNFSNRRGVGIGVAVFVGTAVGLGCKESTGVLADLGAGNEEHDSKRKVRKIAVNFFILMISRIIVAPTRESCFSVGRGERARADGHWRGEGDQRMLREADKRIG